MLHTERLSVKDKLSRAFKLHFVDRTAFQSRSQSLSCGVPPRSNCFSSSGCVMMVRAAPGLHQHAQAC